MAYEDLDFESYYDFNEFGENPEVDAHFIETGDLTESMFEGDERLE